MKKEKVLLFINDDDSFSRAMKRQFISEFGELWVFMICGDLPQAYKALEAQIKIDLAIVDLGMDFNLGRDGELTRTLRSKGTKVMWVSGVFGSDAEDLANSLGIKLMSAIELSHLIKDRSLLDNE